MDDLQTIGPESPPSLGVVDDCFAVLRGLRLRRPEGMEDLNSRMALAMYAAVRADDGRLGALILVDELIGKIEVFGLDAELPGGSVELFE